MAEPEPFNKPHLEPKSKVHPKPSKSFSPFLSRLLLVAILLLLLALFPSQAPESIAQTRLTKLWELLHLLFIGIAVSYGLFGRISSETDAEIQPQLDISRSYFSGIFHVSSMFEDGYENPCGSDEKRLQISRSIAFPNELSQTWNSQHFQGESLVYVSEENCVLDEWENGCVLDEWENPKPIIDFKPLNLPVRSLRSRIVDHDSPESDPRGDGSGSDSKGSSNNSDETRDGKIRGLNPTILEENVALPSPIPWRSRSISRMEVKDDVKAEKSEIDHLKSESFWSPIFSQSSSVPSPPKKAPASSPSPSPSPPTVLAKDRNPELEPIETEDSSESAPTLSLRSGEATLLSKSTRRFSIGSLSEVNSQRNGGENLKSFSKSMRESTNTEAKAEASAFMKPLPRGKSVRTIRARESVPNASKIGETAEFDMIFEQNLDQISGKQSLQLPSIDVEKAEPENRSEIVHASVGEEEEIEEEEEEEDEEEGDQAENVDDSELYSSEVDRKAGEFIAKFKEQIRLQKISSFRRSNGF
ncbi:uncharacterized protein LOC127813971 [Diospyros lotus]|uniref:uncharacterized protein LOC127813971 n=1 Tax=Diospyros lotus TaxID=55363 RepID=UPI0022518ECB|nr:uncharacterized protein LOC127813971 [Diospyros lotus]